MFHRSLAGPIQAENLYQVVPEVSQEHKEYSQFSSEQRVPWIDHANYTAILDQLWSLEVSCGS